MNDTPHREADRSGVIRGLSSRRPRRRFHPVKSPLRLLLFLGITLLLVYGVVLVAVRSEGVRRFTEDGLTKHLGANVTLGGMKLTSCLSWVFEDLHIAGGVPGADCSVDRLVGHPDLWGSLTARAWRFSRAEASGVELDVMETRDGFREPVALTRLGGLHTWNAETEEASPGNAPPPARGTDPPTLPEPPARSRVDFSQMALSVRGMRLRVRDPEGVVRIEGRDIEVGFDPGNDSVVTPASRYSIRGEVRMTDRAGEPRPLHLELMKLDGAWHLLPGEEDFTVDMHLLRWVSDVLAGRPAAPLTGTQ